jgi:hypothetical protein
MIFIESEGTDAQAAVVGTTSTLEAMFKNERRAKD